MTAPLLISTVHRLPQHPLSLFPACSAFKSRPPATAFTAENLQLLALTSLLSGEYRATEFSTPSSQLSTNCSIGNQELDCRFSTERFLRTTLNGPNRKHRLQRYAVVVGVFTDPFLNPVVLLLWAWPCNGNCLQSHSLATGLYATTSLLARPLCFCYPNTIFLFLSCLFNDAVSIEIIQRR
jgi:hypothetical protein